MRILTRKGFSVAIALLAGAPLLAGCNNSRQITSAAPGPPAEPISVHQLAGQLSLRLARRPRYHALLIGPADSVSVFADPGGGVFVNGVRLDHAGPIVAAEGTIFVPGSVARSIRAVLRRKRPRPAPQAETRVALATVVLDPGHGGRDPGAVGCNGMFEKHCVLAVAREVRRRLQDAGAEVLMTRSDDRFLPLEARAEIANRARADLFVSIHADSAPSRPANGHTAYVARRASQASLTAARCIVRRLAEAGIRSRGVRRADLRVLVQTNCPAVLMEIGYLSNRAEARLLADGRHRQVIAGAVAQGILDALGR